MEKDPIFTAREHVEVIKNDINKLQEFYGGETPVYTNAVDFAGAVVPVYCHPDDHGTEKLTDFEHPYRQL